MSWGTSFSTEIYLIRETFHTKYNAEERIAELERELVMCEQEIMMFAAANVKDLVPDDFKEEPLSFIRYRMNELLEDHEKYAVRIYQIKLLLEVFDSRITD
jgi:hypothetical protein